MFFFQGTQYVYVSELMVNVSKNEDGTKLHQTKTSTFSYPSTATVNLTYEVYCAEGTYKGTIQPY